MSDKLLKAPKIGQLWQRNSKRSPRVLDFDYFVVKSDPMTNKRKRAEGVILIVSVMHNSDPGRWPWKMKFLCGDNICLAIYKNINEWHECFDRFL